ncbi:MAG: phosphoribosylamine--glycine ligase, partial [Flavobacteriales bacterium]|nr:phosphoribosylamine--glycine ligase [Flavobacteriales bacterium]MDW8410829.1 phosphoribosylglycinamide synthetase C domain-containing protein [Flavobacteriales bacterium]
AGRKVLIEEFLQGMECSVFVLTDGQSYRLLPEAKDYKRIGEGNTGPNTGGMGAISPVSFAGEEFMDKVLRRIVEPTLKGLRHEGIIYKGFLYFGLMNVEGEPYVVEYNCRLGDPEAEAILPRIITDWVLAFEAIHQECVNDVDLLIDPKASAAVVLASQGYPDHYDTGFLISGLDVAEDVRIFQAGTKTEGGRIFTAGGRVLVVNALASTLREALEKCYHAADHIHFDNKYFRRDIGRDVLD